MKIKTTLKELSELFAASSADENLSDGERKLAARMCVLTMHIYRVETLVVAEAQARKAAVAGLDKRFAEFIEKLGADLGQVIDTVAKGDAQPGAGEAPAAANGEPAGEPEEGEVDDEEKALAEFLAASNAEAQQPNLPTTTPPASMAKRGAGLPTTTPPAPMPPRPSVAKPVLVKDEAS